MAHKTVCVFSGGMDSTTLLHQLLHLGDDVSAISFNYGQRHVKELEYAARTCEINGVDHEIVDLTTVTPLLKGSALTSAAMEIPKGHYRDESMKATVVPNRNMIFMSIAGGYAVSRGYDRLAVAVHAGDHAVYPDCRPEFIESFEKTLSAGNYRKISVFAPFLHWTKGDIAKLGLSLGIDFMADTWSCYEGGELPCGECGTCVEREEALKEAAGAHHK